MAIRVVRLGTARAADEGLRIGTVRRPPRGVPKSEFASQNWYDVWFPNLAPSVETMKLGQVAETPAQWAAFARKYRAEMAAPANDRTLELLARLSHQTNFSVGCYCENEARCHRSLLKTLLLEKGAKLALVLWAFVLFCTSAGAGPLDKKVIEYGWDVPTPAQMRDELAAMEKRPFDGLIFRLSAGHNAFVTKPLEAAKFAEDEKILRDLQFARFHDNFVLVWGSPPAAFDWFSDPQWATIEANAKLLVGVAQAGRVRGICFDPEPYDFSLWHYAKQPGTNLHSFADYRAKVRERGAQLMRAFEKSMPGAAILTFFHVSLYDRFATLSEAERAQRLARESWGLMPDFFVGMLESASPQARFIDGNENAYYYTSREQYFRAYHAIRERARGLVPAELVGKYERQVRAGQALYVDQNFALRQPNTEKYLSYRLTPEERARWFEHNTYWALYTTDEFVWCYSERMNWWKDQVPPGLEAAITSAREKITAGKPLGFEIEPLLESAGKR